MIDWPAFLSTGARIDFWTIVVGVVCNASCAILGCYLVLRRMSLLGDAISHSVVAGIAVAFLLSGSSGWLPMFVGALAVGVLTSFLTQTLQSLGRVPEDSSMGVVFTSLFALGVILISRMKSTHLDEHCVLFGRYETVAVDVASVGGVTFPYVLQTLGPVLVLCAVFVTLFWKELKVASFDPLLASAMGISAMLVHYLLMGMVAAVTVSAMQAVGAIVVIAMLIVPAATAHLLTDRLNRMILLAVLVGALSAVFGCLWAHRLETNAAGMTAVVAGIFFAAAVFLSPRHGLASKLIHNAQLALRIASEDVIAKIYRIEETATGHAEPFPVSRSDCLQFGGGGWLARLAVPILQRRGQLAAADPTTPGAVQLTEQGRRMGGLLVRSHRLWEAYLDEHFELPPDHLHEPAEQIEHFIGPELQERLAEELELPDVDPHGKPIPPSRKKKSP